MRQFGVFSTAAVALALSVTETIAVAAIADPSHSQITFATQQSEVRIDGRFEKYRADIEVDPAHPQDGKVKVEVDPASVDAGGSDANTLLKSKEFFDVAHFPHATFEATSIEALPDGRLRAIGPFTLKGHSANIVIPFTIRGDASGLWFEGSTKISRLAFKVGEGQWADPDTVADEVQIQFKLQVAH